MGPRDRIETGSTSISPGETDPIIPNRNSRTAYIHKRTSKERYDPTIQEPVYGVILLHKEKGQNVTTGTRLSPRKQMVHTKPIPPTIDSRTSRQAEGLLPVHEFRHTMGLQQRTNQRR